MQTLFIIWANSVCPGDEHQWGYLNILCRIIKQREVKGIKMEFKLERVIK